ncbi:carboxypeptidase-like regulatory domain-containing protein [Flavobacterium subsaxonicum]|uniref:carboxypeptidase-like regulatory domain-containing protein n=1 Tax=Flavobacterium subsaxonicum TaxID=426226 RepID=UPI0003F9E822|nr:carboxypeptidase-like regulatory domain-containing protein [Flavobacterium subsaxonicum]
MKRLLLLLCLINCVAVFCQNRVVTGTVNDSIGPLESVSVMAQPTQKEAALKFAITDDKGRYRLVLEATLEYTITVSYIGFNDESFTIKPHDNVKEHHFKLLNNNETLKEIVIDYEVTPITVKKDTLIFNVESFTNGAERKLKDQLKKLPGVEVDREGNVMLQGKKVTTFMVEGKDFFGGGTKLGVENIPADAVDKVEFLDHFSEVGFMKEVSGSNQLAVNIKLRKDKKEFVFGDVQAASGPDDFYKLHTGLFYYKPNLNISFIGDLNNTGSSMLDFSDIARFEGGSSFLLDKKASTELFNYAGSNKDVVDNKTRFAAANFLFQATKKLEVSGYALNSGTDNNTKNETFTEYLENSTTTYENRLSTGSNNLAFTLLKLKLKYNPNAKEQYTYTANAKFNTLNANNLLVSQTNINTTNFTTAANQDNFSFRQFLEWHKSHSAKANTSFVLSHSFDNRQIDNTWMTDELFLSGLIPLQQDDFYNLQQYKNVKNNTLNALLKYYLIANNFNHLYFSAGNILDLYNYNTRDWQEMQNGNINDFSSAGFGNNLNYTFNDAFAGVEYKFLIGKWTNRPSVFLHVYSMNTSNLSVDNNFARVLAEPSWYSEYAFSNAESLTYDYKLDNEFPGYNRLADMYTLQNYKAIYKGNAMLRNERYHRHNLNYKKNNIFYGLMLNTFISYYKKNNAIIDEVVLQDINQYTTPVQRSNPETNLNFVGTITKDVYKFNIGINTNLSSYKYAQTINAQRNNVTLNSQDVGIALKTRNVKWPYITLRYNKNFTTFKSVLDSKVVSDVFSADYEVIIKKDFAFKVYYNYQRNKDSNNLPTDFSTLNASLEYRPQNSPWLFEINATNILDTRRRNTNTVSDFYITSQSTYILPRIVMLSLSYKL